MRGNAQHRNHNPHAHSHHHSHGSWSLNPNAVRERARSIPGCQELPTNGDNILSFLVGYTNERGGYDVDPHHGRGHGHEQDAIDKLARINIFVDTGTIGTCRVLNGQTRETFRRNVSSLDVVERLLRYPPTLTKIDNTMIQVVNSNNTDSFGKNSNNNKGSKASHAASSTGDSTSTLKEEMELAEVGLCILQGEKEKLENHLAHLERTQNYASNNNDTTSSSAKQQQLQVLGPQNSNMTNQTGETPNSNSNNTNSGNGTDDSEISVGSLDFLFSLPAPAMKHVDQCLKDIAKMGKLVRGVATNGRGTIFLYGNGGVAYTPNIPKSLYHRLKQLRNSHISSRPAYVSLGTRDRYFVAFKDGTCDWKGPKALDKILKRLDRNEQPRSVTFGNTYETFFVVYKDGSWKFHGRTIPSQLANKLSDRNDRPDLVCVNLGPKGEWFMRTQNGRMWWGGIGEQLDNAIQGILKDGGFLHFIDFGEDGSYFLSHESS